MVLAICLQSRLESCTKAIRFRKLLSDIAEVTYSSEYENHAYCWFQKSKASELEGEWLCGFEMYDNEKALVETHRSSAEYKMMRERLAEERFYGDVLPQITFYEPFGDGGFLSNGDGEPEKITDMPDTFIVISKYTAGSKGISALAPSMEKAAELSREQEGVLSYFPLVRQQGDDSVITVFERYSSEAAYKCAALRMTPIWDRLATDSDSVIVTTWEQGIGHIRSAPHSSNSSCSDA